MKEATITVTEASRNFADCINRAHYQNISFILLRNGRPFARIEPESEKRCTGMDLAKALGSVALSHEEACEWRHELQTAREKLQTPTDKWQ